MNANYIITNEELAEQGLNLNDYVVEGTFINAIINKGLYIVLDRMCAIGDQFKGYNAIEEYLSMSDKNYSSVDKISAFKHVQYLVIYNLIFTNESEPVDRYVDSVLVFQLGCKINGFQKGLHYKNN